MTAVLDRSAGPAAGINELPLADLRESPQNPRRTFDPAALKELAASLRTHGMLTPILVRPIPDGGEDAGLFEIAAGHRRFRAAELAGLDRVPVVVRVMTDAQFLEVLTIENLQREDLHPLEEAEGYHALLRLPGYDVATLAAKVARSESYVHQRLRLRALIPAAQKAFLAGEWTVAVAIHLARLQPADQKACLAGWAFGRNTAVSAKEVANWIDENVHADLHRAPWEKADADLLPAAGACTTCPKRSGFTPALFPDLAKRDTCTDRRCYQAKLRAHLAGREQELKAQHPNLVRIHDGYGEEGLEDDRSALGYGKWWPAKKADPGARLALVVRGKDVGDTRYVTLSPPKGPARTTADPWRAKQAADKAKRDREVERRRRLVQATLPKLAGTLDHDALRALAVAFIQELRYDQAQQLAKALDLTASKTKHGMPDQAGAVAKAVGTMTPEALARFLRLLPAHDELEVSTYSMGKAPTRLLELAKAAKVDVRAIDAELAAERKAKATPTKKAAKPKARAR